MMMKKRVLFCIRDFNHGGIPKSLENLLALIDKDKYEISVFCAFQQGPYKQIFEKYNLLPQNRLFYWFCVNYRTLSGAAKIKAMVIKLVSKLFLKVNIDVFGLYQKRVARKLAASASYDVAVAYAEGFISRFVSYMDAISSKIAWIHMDYKRILSYEKGEDDVKIYSEFDYIVSPCKFSARSFVDVHPQLADKVRSIKNVLDVQTIKNDVLEPFDDKKHFTGGFKILSVGRICYEKQFYKIPAIAKELKKHGFDFKWYVIGDGPAAEVAVLKENIRICEVENCVVLLGAKNNCYPYIADCDLVALLSLSETFSYVAYESKVLGVPVITTDFGAAPEIIENGTGIIAPMELYAGKLMQLMSDKGLYESLKENLRDYKYDNQKILCEIYSLFNR